jgi:hypothetical protein
MYINDIKINAGVIRRPLNDKGVLSIREIGEMTRYREEFILYALGRPARENKIRFFEKEGNEYVELKISLRKCTFKQK